MARKSRVEVEGRDFREAKTMPLKIMIGVGYRYSRIFAAGALGLSIFLAADTCRISAQDTPFIFAKDNYCAGNQANLESVIQMVPEAGNVIVVAHRGVKEGSNLYAFRRLNEITQTLRHTFDSSRLVLATAQVRSARPQVKIYVEGKLRLVFETPNKVRLKVRNCDK